MSALGRAELPINVKKVIVARDDDAPWSPASLALGRGVARLLFQGREVEATRPPGGFAVGAKDINDLLQIDANLAHRQLDETVGPSLVGDAEMEALLDEVSRASRDVYEKHRKAIANALNWRAKVLDEDRRDRQIQRKESGEDDPVTNIAGAAPWPDPVPDLGAVLDALVAQVKRFLIVPDPTYFDTIALWCAHTHLLHEERFGVGFTPKLAYQSPIKRCGKSTGLKCTHLTSHNSRLAASITPASLFRAVDALKISLMADEADNIFKNANPDLLAIINSSSDRMTAKVTRADPVGDGKFEAREFNTFAAIALTSIQQLPDTVQDRCIVLPLKRAKKCEKPERLTLRTRGPLIEIGRKLARWAADLGELPDPDMPPDLFNRIEDKWFVLFQVAEIAGGEWPERCRKAALADLEREDANDADGGQSADLLADVWQVFHEHGVVRMFTKALCQALNDMTESPWKTANHGKQVDGYFLRKHLRDFVPDNAESIAPRKWREGSDHAHGYYETHFQDAFSRYLDKGLPSEKKNEKGGKNDARAQTGKDDARTHGAEPSIPSVHPSQTVENEAGSNIYTGTDEKTPSVPHTSHPGGFPPWDGSGADDPKPSVPANRMRDQSVNGDGDGWVDGMDTYRPSSPAHNRKSPKRGEPNGSGAPSDIVPYPRGAQRRRRRDQSARGPQ